MNLKRRVAFDIITGTCSICGKKYTYFPSKSRNSVFRGMKKYDACPNCASWLTRKNKAKYKEVMIEGKLYMLIPFKRFIRMREIENEDEFRGFAIVGEKNEGYVLELKTMKPVKYKSLILVGEPPEPLRTEDTATFISRHDGLALKDGMFECRGCTCLDRYTCLFYFREKMEGDKPANKIPENWKDGDEKCRNYININNTNKHLLEWRKKKQGQ